MLKLIGIIAVNLRLTVATSVEIVSVLGAGGSDGLNKLVIVIRIVLIVIVTSVKTYVTYVYVIAAGYAGGLDSTLEDVFVLAGSTAMLTHAVLCHTVSVSLLTAGITNYANLIVYTVCFSDIPAMCGNGSLIGICKRLMTNVTVVSSVTTLNAGRRYYYVDYLMLGRLYVVGSYFDKAG